ncbi:MAG: NUDIX domain-containing protein [Nanoarchaeota archaeon]|nr:NUDIX domain-containing protein [Nanoarchaeota archaeon]
MELNKKVQAIIFRDRGHYFEYLLLHTNPQRRSFWQNVTGKVENENEDLKSAIIREVFEETGIENPQRIIDNIYSFKYPVREEFKEKYGFDEFEEEVFAMEVENNTVINIDSNKSKEHDDFIWCSYDGAHELLEYDSNKKALEILNEKLVKEKLHL